MKPAVMLVLAFAFLPLQAATVDVTAASFVTLDSGHDLLFYIRTPAGFSDPGCVAILLGGMPVDAPAAAIPGTSSVYAEGMLFSGTLESMDGTAALPLFDPNAARLGLPAGHMVLQTGFHSGGAYSGSISVLSANAALSSPEAAGLLSDGWGVVRFHNLGAEVTFGYSGASITAAFSASLISSDGAVSRGALPVRVVLQQTPEPATLALFLAGLAVLALVRRHFSSLFRS